MEATKKVQGRKKAEKKNRKRKDALEIHYKIPQ
jgi:hypothetical protein